MWPMSRASNRLPRRAADSLADKFLETKRAGPSHFLNFFGIVTRSFALFRFLWPAQCFIQSPVYDRRTTARSFFLRLLPASSPILARVGKCLRRCGPLHRLEAPARPGS